MRKQSQYKSVENNLMNQYIFFARQIEVLKKKMMIISTLEIDILKI
jgi:hypothetical protein